ncbi:ATP-grasp fold amidoligase family protein, partial [Helicobacter canis]
KFHCFGGQIFIQVDTERFTSHTRTMFDTEWNKMDFSLCFPQPKYTPQPPNNPQLMIEIATILAKHCSYVRVDLYAIDTDIIVGELTYTHGGGTEKFTPNEWDKKLGDLWH